MASRESHGFAERELKGRNVSDEGNTTAKRDNKNIQILVSGASGLIGRALVRHLSKHGYGVRTLVRHAPGPGEVRWDPSTGSLDPSQLTGVQAVVHLAGENIGARWTRQRKARIRSSRLQGTQLLSEALASLRPVPSVMVSASAVGIYGNRGDEILSEESLAGDRRRDFLVGVVQDWEAAAEPARKAGIRVVHPRFGVALSQDGGALARMLPVFRVGLGGRLGSGVQWMSWIAIDDLVAAVHHLIKTETLHGAVNVTVPEPSRNADFARTLGQVLGRPAAFPVPSAALHLAFGEMAASTLLASTRVIPNRLLSSGYRFSFPDLGAALQHVLRNRA
jgi:uncharacterized protein